MNTQTSKNVFDCQFREMFIRPTFVNIFAAGDGTNPTVEQVIATLLNLLPWLMIEKAVR